MERLVVRRRRLLRRQEEGGADLIGDDDGDNDGSFASCVEEDEGDDRDAIGPEGDDEDDNEGMWSALAMELYLPMLDGEVHASLVRRMAAANYDGDDEGIGGKMSSSSYAYSSSSSSSSSFFGKTIHGWTSSWFCSVEAMPISVSARVVDFLMASHPTMPL